MSEAIIFAIGSVLFVLTTGATVTFGLYRSHELQVRDMEESERITEIEERGLTEIYRTKRLDSDETAVVDVTEQ